MTMDNITVEWFSDSCCYSVEARSDIGSREQQQDQAYLHIGKERIFAVVCDGMGGTSNGGNASKMTVSIMQSAYTDYCLEKNSDDSAFLYRAMADADKAVSSSAVCEDGGTTLVSVVISKNQMHWISVGDSKLYVMRSGEILQATRDHNYRLWLDKMLQNGEIDTNIYEKELERGDALISYIGKGNITLYDLTQSPFTLQQGDTVLLTTDGLTNAISDEEICSIVSLEKSTVSKAEALLRSVQAEGIKRPQDNSTFIIIDVL